MADREFDRHVKRTANRPVTSGALPVKEALGLGAGQVRMPFDVVADHARLVGAILHPVDVDDPGHSPLPIGAERGPAREDDDSRPGPLGVVEHAAGHLEADIDVEEAGLWPTGDHEMSVGGGEGDDLVRAEDDPRHGNALVVELCDRLEHRERVARHHEELGDAVAGKDRGQRLGGLGDLDLGFGVVVHEDNVYTTSAMLHHVAIRTAHLEGSIRFYQDALGLGEALRWDHPPLVTAAAFLEIPGGGYVELFADADPEAAVAVPETAPGFGHLALTFEDVQAAFDRAIANGATELAAPATRELYAESRTLEATLAFVLGPSGEVIELYRNDFLPESA